MKKRTLISLLLVTLFTYSCQHDEPLQQGTVQFSFNSISSGNTGGRKQTDDIPDGASLIMSLTKSNGDSVFTWKKIDLLKIGNKFITGPLPLLQGNYLVTDFMIVGPDNAVLFAAPKTGSSSAALVTQPLPVPFSVTINQVSTVDVEVLDANHKNPEDFGYVSFGVKVIPNTGFSASVFITDQAQVNITSAEAYILHGADTLLSKKLGPVVNNLNWKAEPSETYTLVIIKDGYDRYTKNFGLASLITQLHGQPLPVVLKPALTFRWSNTPASSQNFSPLVLIQSTPGEVMHVNWGDGVIQDASSPFDFGIAFQHPYETPGNYFVSVTGTLDSIKGVSFGGQAALIDTISLGHLFWLEFLSTRSANIRSQLDFSHNTKLKTLDLGAGDDDNLRTLDISKNPLLTTIYLTGSTLLSQATINKMIDDLYASIVLNNKRDGSLFLGGGMASPSPAQLAKLQSLKDDYGWLIF